MNIKVTSFIESKQFYYNDGSDEPEQLRSVARARYSHAHIRAMIKTELKFIDLALLDTHVALRNSKLLGHFKGGNFNIHI